MIILLRKSKLCSIYNDLRQVAPLGQNIVAHLIPPLADVDLDDGVGVDGVADVRVDDHAEEARVGLQELKKQGLEAG